VVYALFLLCLFWSGYFGLGPAFRFKDRIDHAGTRTRVGNLNNFIRLNRKNITMFFFLSGNSKNPLSRYEPPFSHSYIPVGLKVRTVYLISSCFFIGVLALRKRQVSWKFLVKLIYYVIIHQIRTLFSIFLISLSASWPEIKIFELELFWASRPLPLCPS
jgi:hypothetical protein